MTDTNQSTNDRRRALWCLSLAVIAISFAASLLIKAGPTDPIVIAGLRLSLAALILLPICLREAKSIDRNFLLWSMVGGLCYAVHFGAWVWSLNLTTIAASVTLVTVTPLILGVAGWLMGRDQPSRALWLALALSVVGVIVISSGTADGGRGSQLGNALAFLGALAMAGYLLVARRLRHQSPLLLLAIATATGGSLLLGTALLSGISIIPVSSESFFWIVMATLVPQLIGHTALTYSLKTAPPTTAAMATVAEPVGATIVAWFVLGQSVGPVVLIGSAVTIVGVAIAAKDLSG